MPVLQFEFPENNGKDKYDVGCRCEHCGSYLKRYRRTLNSSMVLTLINLYKAGVRDYVHVEKWLHENNHPRSGDFHKLTLWGLLDKLVEERKDGSQRNGYYRLNGKSLLFVEGKLKVQQYAVILNGNFQGFEGKEVTIVECLSKKFNFNQLMSIQEPLPA